MSSLAADTWLILRNDLRLLWRDLQASRWSDYLSLGLVVVLFCIANAIAIGVFFAFRRQPPIGYEAWAWYFFAFMMLGAAMNHAIAVLFERADFELLLPAPISSRAILLARLTAMTASAAFSVALLLLPLVNGAVLAVAPRYAAGYVVWLWLSAAVASAGVWFTLLLVRWLGPRRARVWAQVVAAVLSAGVYLAFQGGNLLRETALAGVIAQITRAIARPPLSFLAQAGRGEWRPLLALAALTAGFALLTLQLLSRMFLTGAQEGGAIVPPRQARLSTRPFLSSPARATFWKDLRLIARDPLLLAKVLPTALYILPVFFGLRGLGGVALLAPVAVFLTAQFSQILTFVAAASDECWDLIRMSPTPELRLRLARIAAGMALPMLGGLVLCAVVAIAGRPGLALLALAVSFACSAACCWVTVARIKPTPRNDVLRRRSTEWDASNIVRGILNALLMLCGAAGVGFFAHGAMTVAAVLLGLTALGVLTCLLAFRLEEIKPREFVSPGGPG